MSYNRLNPEITSLQPIPDDVRAEMDTYLRALQVIRELLEGTKGPARTEMQVVLDQEGPRELEMKKILKAGGIQTTAIHEGVVLYNKALDTIEAELASYNAYLAKYGPKA